MEWPPDVVILREEGAPIASIRTRRVVALAATSLVVRPWHEASVVVVRCMFISFGLALLARLLFVRSWSARV
jgi:hypothetical protein